MYALIYGLSAREGYHTVWPLAGERTHRHLTLSSCEPSLLQISDVSLTGDTEARSRVCSAGTFAARLETNDGVLVAAARRAQRHPIRHTFRTSRQHFPIFHRQRYTQSDLRSFDKFRSRTHATVRRGHVAVDGFDKLGEANPKRPIGIAFIDQFGEEE